MASPLAQPVVTTRNAVTADGLCRAGLAVSRVFGSLSVATRIDLFLDLLALWRRTPAIDRLLIVAVVLSYVFGVGVAGVVERDHLADESTWPLTQHGAEKQQTQRHRGDV
jgi:hypothetical protein